MPPEKKLIIIDGHSLLYRAFHALPPLSNSKGQMTNAVYGFLLILFKAMKDLEANYVVACFDTKKPTFRHEQFKEYKAHRAPMPEGISSQIPMMKMVLEALSVPQFEKEGFEADDLVATIAQKAKAGADVYILSGDLDNLQLVDEKTKVYTLGKGIKDTVVYDKARVVERFGVEPVQMNDFKALTGDNSDNIPGVPGIGKTTAADLIQKFGSIENLYAEIATDTAVLRPKVKEALKENKDKAFLSLQLVKTDKSVDMEFNLDDCKFNNFDRQKVKEIFGELGFNSLIERLNSVIF
ncbi:MAG: 5'-3' exonuclease H3TH domain-containing protein [bacterium]|nr:5'-3' exonuclease H3TH domain-containing protein [bacterium]